MREGKKRRTRVLAYLMVFAMMMSLVVVPAKKVQAAEDIVLTVSTLGDVDTGNHAEMEITGIGYDSIASLVSAGYTKLSVTYKVDSFTPTSDGETAGVQPYYSYGDSWTYYTGGVWENLALTTQSIELSFDATSTGAAEELKRFGLQFCNITALSISDVTAKLVYTGESSSSGTSTGGGEQPSSDIVLKTSKPTDNGNYTEFMFEITNNSSSDFTGISIVIPSSTSASITKYKSEVTGVYDSDIPGYIVHYNVTVKSGESFSDADYKVGIPLGSSNFGTPYILYINSSAPSGSTGGGTISDSTNLDLDLEYNYAKLLQESLYFYDANMCGDQVGEKSAFSWRDDCHLDDMSVQYGDTTVDVSGGYHDAGDHVKFGITEGYSAATLALSYYEFGDAFDELGQTEHYKLIMDHFCDYFVNCAIYSDNDNKTGTIQSFCYNVGDGTDGSSGSDHGYWGKPENQSGCNRAGMTLFTSASQPATDIVSISACALALHAYNFKDDENSEKYIRVAKDLYAYAKNNSKGCYSVTQYDSNSYQDDMAAAAAALYLATGDSTYKTEAESYAINTGWVLCWNNTDGIVAALLNNNDAMKTIASTTGNGNTSQGFRLVLPWGSCRYNTAEQFMGLIYDKHTNSSTFASWATGQMKYILGNNNNKRCFVVGYNENSSKWPHHRAASNSTDANLQVDSHYTLLGALVGGPTDTSDSYTDSQAEYTANEVALDYNATLVGAAAGLYLLHKDDSDAVNTLATQEQLEKIGGVDKFYTGGGSATPVVAVESISVDPATTSEEPVELQIGETAAATVTITPDDATNKNYTVVSDDTSVASVTKTTTGFKVEGKATGTAAITVTASADKTKKAVYYVKVVAPAITSISLNKESVTLDGTGKTATATVTVLPAIADKTKINVASSDEDVATVKLSGSTLTITSGSKSGTATITLASTEDPTIKATCKVTVTHSVTGFTLNKETLSIAVSEKAELSVASVEPVGADKYTVNWSVDDDTVVSLDKTTGDSIEITGLKKGKATVTAKIGTLTKTIDVTVSLAAQAAPTVSYTVISQTSNQIKVKAATESTGTLELSLDKTTWVQAVDGVYTFDGLEAGADITIYARLAETQGQTASDVSSDTAVTYTVYDPAKIKDEDGNYIVDVSKITSVDCDYVKKLASKVENGVPTTNIDVEASGDTIVITTKDGKDYVISGSNDKVVITITAGSDIILEDASVNQIVVNGSTAISLQGTNMVTNGITIGVDSTVTIAEVAETDGSLDVSSSTGSAISGEGNVVINGGTVSAESTATGGNGIQVADFEVNGGNVTVSSSSGNGIVAENIQLSGENTTIGIVSENAAISGNHVEVSGANVSLEVTGNDASVIEAGSDITLNSGNIETTRPSDSNGYDYAITAPEGESAGSIIIGDDVIISGNPEYSTTPVDSQGNEITFANITVHDGETTYVLQSRKNTVCNLMDDVRIYNCIQAQPYRTAVFLVDNEEVKEGKIEVKEDDVNVVLNWVPKQYKITYECNGGSFTNDEYKTSYTIDDGVYKLPTTNIEKKNYVFMGWYADSDFKNQIETVSVEENQDITVYAKWLIDKPEKPVITNAVNTYSGVTIQWKAVEGVNYYILQRKESGKSWTKLAVIDDATATSYTDKTVVNGQSYLYRICGYGFSCGDFSASSNTVRYIAAPKLLALSNGNNGVTIKWGAVSGVTGYLIYRSTNGGSYTRIANVIGASVVTYNDKTATGNAVKYQYRIYAYKTYGTSVCKSGSSTIRTIYHLAVPSVPNASISSSGMKLTWTGTVGATGYYVYRSVNGGGLTKIATVSGRTYFDKKVYNGNKYQYKIVAYKSVSGVAYRSSVSSGRTSYYIVPPRIYSLTNSASKTMTAKWSKNSSASGYLLQYSTSSSFSNAITFTLTSNSTISKKMTGLSKGKTYYVRVRSYKVVGKTKYYSGWSETSSVKITK